MLVDAARHDGGDSLGVLQDQAGGIVEQEREIGLSSDGPDVHAHGIGRVRGLDLGARQFGIERVLHGRKAALALDLCREVGGDGRQSIGCDPFIQLRDEAVECRDRFADQLRLALAFAALDELVLLQANGGGLRHDGVDGLEQLVDALGLREGMLLRSLQARLLALAPLHGLLRVGEVLIRVQRAVDAAQDGARDGRPLLHVGVRDFAMHQDAQGWQAIHRRPDQLGGLGLRGLVGRQIGVELAPSGLDLGLQCFVRVDPAMALLDQVALARPLRAHEQARLGSLRDHELLIDLNQVVQRKGNVLVFPAIGHALAQHAGQPFVLEVERLRESQAVERGRQVRPLQVADDRIERFPDDFLSQWQRQALEPVARVEDDGLLVFRDLGLHAQPDLVKELAPGLVGADAHHCRRIAGVPHRAAIGQPFRATLDKFVEFHGVFWLKCDQYRLSDSIGQAIVTWRAGGCSACRAGSGSGARPWKLWR